MTMRKIAELAGVSTATVSRVFNQHPTVHADIVARVRHAMSHLDIMPTVRKNSLKRRVSRAAPGTVAFLIFFEYSANRTETFDRLLKGVSNALSRHNRTLILSYVTAPDQIPDPVMNHTVEGVLLFGKPPRWDVKALLGNTPACWVMGNPSKPGFGDQVMPDNLRIGDLAAQYLADRGHQRVACFSTGHDCWWLKIRTSSFIQSARGYGLDAMHLVGDSEEMDRHDGQLRYARSAVDRLLAMPQRPTALFVAEDLLLPALHHELSRRGLRTGKGQDLEIISCNNEQQTLAALPVVPTEIDILAESIGAWGVEQLLARIQNRVSDDRVRICVEPQLVETN